VFPPLLVHVGDDEILLGDSTRLAEAMGSAGGSVELKIWPNLWHVFPMWTPQLPEANEAIAHIGKFIRAKSGFAHAAY
jgi:acetyl esterase/lipase